MVDVVDRLLVFHINVFLMQYAIFLITCIGDIILQIAFYLKAIWYLLHSVGLLSFVQFRKIVKERVS